MTRSLTIGLCIAFVASMLSGCGLTNCESGSGPAVITSIAVDEFQGIALNGSFDVEWRSGSTQQVEVHAQEGLAELLETSVSNGIWHIRTSQCVRYDGKFLIKITSPGLEHIAVKGSGSATAIDTLVAPTLELSVQGSGDIIASVRAKKVDAKIQGSGDIALNGTCAELDAVVQGSGDIKAADMTSGQATARIQGSGDIKLSTTGTLTARVMGSGDIRYAGSPASIDSDIKGSGSVSKL